MGPHFAVRWFRQSLHGGWLAHGVWLSLSSKLSAPLVVRTSALDRKVPGLAVLTART